MGQAARAQHQVSSHSQPVTTGRQAKVDCLDDDCSTICCSLGPAPWGLAAVGSHSPTSTTGRQANGHCEQAPRS